jgi:hypothetical protein
LQHNGVHGAAQEQPWQYNPQPLINAQYQQSVRQDKSSILALYNYPQLAPQRQLQTLPEDGTASQQMYEPPQHVPQRSATMPPTLMNGNPFGQPPPQQQVSRHVSNESKDFQGFAGGGRHSPDAFSGLAARYH